MFNRNAKKIKKLKKKIVSIEQIVAANNEFLAGIYEALLAENNEEQPKSQIGFKVNKKQDD